MTLRAMYENSDRESIGPRHRRHRGHRPRSRRPGSTTRRHATATASRSWPSSPRCRPSASTCRGLRQGRLQGRRPDAGVRSAQQQEQGVHGGRVLRAEREGQPWRRLRPGDLRSLQESRNANAGGRMSECRPEPQLDADQRREGEHVHALPEPHRADPEDRHPRDLRLQQLRPGVRARRAAHRQRSRRRRRAVRRPAERDQRVDAPHVRPQLRVSKKLGLGFSLLHEKFDVSDYATSTPPARRPCRAPTCRRCPTAPGSTGGAAS